MTRAGKLVSSRNAARALWDSVRTSLWFLPAILAVIAPALTFGALRMDDWLGQGPDNSFFPMIYVSDPGQARDLLSTILTSIITMASLVFSITMVVLTLAAGQFGPRLVRNFMGRLQTQFVLGTFVMTILYCLLLLASIGPGGNEDSNAYLSVTIAIGLTVVSVVLLILYIHELATSIMSETLIEAVGRELDQGVRELPPLDRTDDPEQALPDDFDQKAALSDIGTSGYVQAIEFQRIVDAAQAHDVLIGLYLRAGDFAIRNGRAFGIYPAERATPELAALVSGSITLGTHRTPVQDLEFSIRHLVEVAVRALSPGINDPYTAVSVIHRLSASWPHMMERSVPPGVFYDDNACLRLICPRSTHAGLLNASFSQIRQNGADKPLILIHLLKAFRAMSYCVRSDEQREALRDQVHAILEDARREVSNQADLKDVEQHAEWAMDALEPCTVRHQA
ncbi:DUF2254 domain-containing protein [Paracoccus sp. (in: a-proteobacteria)]|uniref:DUF2254 domain-containing protein n=1 Tax=Paracoccus sp. TaxID=267 RepID=UPI00396CEF96